ncbi:hypothetical protein GCM10014715_10980 [Streptomyces spiralis]|uniref:Uncharacterized protein n=1 Tax=Streptomyces spiralis TaxID=66376 RepID=A0A919DMG6_9ACTN|nr:hypothetical protein GCM10014715_10980 [Streptomyces spiralis]
MHRFLVTIGRSSKRAEKIAEPARSCLARTMPWATGPTISRCEGFATTETAMVSPSRARQVASAPRWYFTSP